jgi:glutathionylspermidine synthase
MERWRQLFEAGIIDDPWLEGRERLSLEPAVLTRTEAGAAAEAACAVALMLDEAMQAAAGDDALLRQLGLDDSLIDIARLDAPRWLALARADVFQVADGGPPQVCEINCDTPTGLAECVGLGRLAAAGNPQLADPSARLRERWLHMVRAAAHPGSGRPVVGILDPTEVTDDLCHIRQLTRWLEEADITVVRGAPFNLHACDDARVGLFATPCDVLLRHYKTDCWAQQRRLWAHARLPAHHAPLARELALIARAMAAGTLGVLNPWGSAIAQNKRTLALPWEQPQLFHPQTLAAVRRHLPETRFLASLPPAQLISEREQWVLKSDYGCEGAEVLVGRHCDPALWASCLAQAVPERWIVQRAFAPRLDAGGRTVNTGVFLVGGMPSGLYTRTSIGPTGTGALSWPTLVGA